MFSTRMASIGAYWCSHRCSAVLYKSIIYYTTIIFVGCCYCFCCCCLFLFVCKCVSVWHVLMLVPVYLPKVRIYYTIVVHLSGLRSWLCTHWQYNLTLTHTHVAHRHSEILWYKILCSRPVVVNFVSFYLLFLCSHLVHVLHLNYWRQTDSIGFYTHNFIGLRFDYILLLFPVLNFNGFFLNLSLQL